MIDRPKRVFFLSFFLSLFPIPPLKSLNSRYRNLGRSVYTGVSGASIFHARLAWMPPFTRRRRGGGGGGGRRRSHSFTATSTTGQAFTIKSRFLRQQGFNARHSRGLRYVCTTSTDLETLSPRQMVRDSPFQTITVTESPTTTTTTTTTLAPNLCRYANKWHRGEKTHNAIRRRAGRVLRAIVSRSNHDRARRHLRATG